MNGFKRLLGTYIDAIPDLPHDPAGGWMPNPTDNHGRSSNSLYHWRPFLQKTQGASFKQLEVIVSSQPGAAQGDIRPEEDHLQEDQDGDQRTSTGVTRTAELRESPPVSTPEPAPVTAPQSNSEESADFRDASEQVKRTSQDPVVGSPELSHPTLEPQHNTCQYRAEELEEEPGQDPRTAREPNNLFPLMGKLAPKAEKGWKPEMGCRH